MRGMFHRATLLMFLLNSFWLLNLQGGGSGFNTVVVVNQRSSNSCELGNYYCERRQVPPENVLRIYWPGGNISWSSNDLQSVLLTPLLDMLAARQLTNQVDYVVLSMDIPFQSIFGATINGTTAALFYGLKSSGQLNLANSYAASEAVFRDAEPTNSPGFSFLTTMITANSLDQAEQLIDRAVASDGTFPLETVHLAKTSDPARNLRYPYFDNAIFNVRIRGASSILRTNVESPSGQTGLLGYETGLEHFSLAPGAFVPGAIADNMTSFGGLIFGPNSQTNLLAFIEAGAAGSYGTVAEPNTDRQKFPDPQVYFYQARGFSLAESYYQSVYLPFLGLMVAEPLSAPFAQAGSGAWPTNLANSILSNTPVLSVQFLASQMSGLLGQVDLFVDGKFMSTLTNVAPCAGNVLTWDLNGYRTSYTVAPEATLRTVVTGLVAAINTPAATNATKVRAFARGDRIELQSMATNQFSVPFFVTDTISTNGMDSSYRVTYLPDSFPPEIRVIGHDRNGEFQMEAMMPTAAPYVVQASTNLMDWTSLSTSITPGILELQDFEATNFPQRFYRVVGLIPAQPPRLSEAAMLENGSFQMLLESDPGQTCAILASTNLLDWTPVLTNEAGGNLYVTDAESTNWECRFYQARTVSLTPPAFTVLGALGEEPLVRVDGAVRPYTVEVSTNEGQWISLCTNFAIGEIQTAVGSGPGNAPVHSTFLSASRSRFQSLDAFGFQGFVVLYNSSPPLNAYLQFTITKTNGQSTVIGITNLAGGVTSIDLATGLVALVNSNSLLQGSDGVVVEDFVVDGGGNARFNVVARSPGLQAAALRVLPKRSGLTISPSSQRTLTQNLSDLLPRNHLYVTAGAGGLTPAFPLDTTTLPDGYHELTAVAYEGSHVRTQTRVSVPVRIQNSSLSATLNLLDLTNQAPVSGSYHIEVAANTNDVSSIILLGTGGVLGMVTNEPAAIFEVQGTNLWAGLHPFYALVETSSGLKYRTETRWIRFVNGQ